MFRVLVYTWQPLSIAFAARVLFSAVSCAQLDDFQLVETSPAPCLVVSLALSYNLFVSFALVWPGNGSFFFVPGNFPLYGLHNRYISSVCGSCVCVCVCWYALESLPRLPRCLLFFRSDFHVSKSHFTIGISWRARRRAQHSKGKEIEMSSKQPSVAVQFLFRVLLLLFFSFFRNWCHWGATCAANYKQIAVHTLCAVPYLPNAKYFVHFPRFLTLTSL